MKLLPMDMWGKPPQFDLESIVGLAHIAGGAIRRWFTGEPQESDIDLFPVNEAACKELLGVFGKPAFSTPTTDTFVHNNKQTVQIVKLYFEDIYKLFDIFDYCHCQFGYSASGEIHATDVAIMSALRKHLRVHRFQPGHEIDSLRRAFKYQRSGFTPCAGTIRDIATAMLNIESKDALDKQVEISPNGGSRIVRFD